MRNLKVASSVLVVIMALSAVAASAASALEYRATETPSGTTYTGPTRFTVKGTGFKKLGSESGLKVECSSSSGEGSIAGGMARTFTTSLVEDSGCAVAGQAATFAMNGCNFTFGEPTGASPFAIKTVTLACPSGKEVVITAKTAGCTIKLPSQTLTETGTTAENMTSEAESPKRTTIKIAISLSGVKITSSGGICGTAGTFSNGHWTWVWDQDGWKNAAHTEPVDLSVG